METPRGGGEIAPTTSENPDPENPDPPSAEKPPYVSPPPAASTLGSALPGAIPHSRSLVSHSARASLGSLAGSEHFVAAQSA